MFYCCMDKGIEMTPQYVTDLPFGYDEKTTIALTASNDVVVYHPVMPSLVYDESIMRWVEIKVAEASHG